MTNNFLIENFKHLTTTPENVEQLKKLVLQMAVQGKLTAKWRADVQTRFIASPELAQSPDYNARALLEKIKTDKEQLIKEGKIKRQKPLPPIADEEVPFELPESWEWVRLDLFSNYGQSLKIEPKKIKEPNTWVLELEDIEKTTSRLLQKVRFKERKSKSTKSVFQKGDVLYGKLRPYLDKVIVADEDGVCTTEIIPIKIIGSLNPYFIRLTLKRSDFLSYVDTQVSGMRMPRLKTDSARNALIPLPPLAEQQAIVTQVEKLFTQIDQLHALAQKRLNYREKSAKALFSKLNHAGNDTKLQEIWKTLTAHFHTLTQSKESVKQLRQSILQMAVQGKLTAKWREDVQTRYSASPEIFQSPDYNASALLQKIKAEKEQLIKEGKIKKQKPLPPIADEEKTFELPESWEWIRLIDYGLTNTGTTPSKNNPEYFGRDYPFVKPAEISLKGINYDTEDGLTKVGLKQGRLIRNNSVLMVCIGGSIGKSFYTNRDVSCNQQINTITPLAWISSEFLHYFFQSIYFQSEVWSRASGGTTPIINKGKWERIPISLPPLEEQKAIVTKVK